MGATNLEHTDIRYDSSSFATDLQSYVFNTGFCHQQFADVQVVFFQTSLKLHRRGFTDSPVANLQSFLLAVPTLLILSCRYHLEVPCSSPSPTITSRKR